MKRALQRSLLIFALVATFAPLAAFAQAAGAFSVLRFRPGIGAYNLLHTESPQVMGHLTPTAGIYLHYDHRPLVFVDAATGKTAYDEVSFQLNAQLVASIGLWDRIEVGIAVPVAILQGSGDRPDKFPLVPDVAGGPGDLRLQIKALLLQSGGFRLGASLPILLPTGSSDNYLGDGGIGLEPRLSASFEAGRFGVGANLGYRVRPNNSFQPALTNQDISVDDEASASVGARFALLPKELDVMVDWSGAVNVQDQETTERAGEVLAGLRAYLPMGFVATAAAGPGIGVGMGVPSFRVVTSLIWSPVPDSDGDGLIGDADKCPNEPEDKDGFEDADGCPDPDNDKDGVPDVKDKCPMEPEDKDSFEDDDGCPDPDNDKDGIPDTADKCPNEPEDKDGFEDADGCPDPDNDKDGVPDTADKCPMEPEDKDGFEDADGCPDPDNDKDGIQDIKDKCPLQPETVNGFEDDDGCPDAKPSKNIRIVKDTIAVPPVFFATNKDQILAKSFPTLTEVATVLNDNPWLKKIRVEGHTDDVGADDKNLDLSQRRADSVVRFLVEHGVAAERLEAKGYGETKPKCLDVPSLTEMLADRSMKKMAKKALVLCRADNRRVAFVIIDPAAEGNTVTRERTVEEPAK